MFTKLKYGVTSSPIWLVWIFRNEYNNSIHILYTKRIHTYISSIYPVFIGSDMCNDATKISETLIFLK